MKKLEQSISTLLYTHDCVIVPGFGGFVTNYKSAFIHPTQHTFSPPSKKIAFNRSLRENDGLLTSLVAKEEKITYIEAGKIINAEIESWNSILEKDRKLNLNLIGKLYFDPEKNLCFEPNHSVNYLLDSFGLPELQSPAIKREGAVFFKKEPSIEKAYKKDKTKIIRRFPWRVAAAILILLGISELGLLSYKTGLWEDASQNFSSINPFSDSSWFQKKRNGETLYPKEEEKSTLPESKWNPESVENTSTIDSSIIIANEIPILENEIVEETKVVPAESGTINSEVDLTEVADRYVVVAGCFEFPENADKLLASLKAKGYPARITGKTSKGLTMVGYNTFENFWDAKRLLKKVKVEDDSTAWLFSKIHS